MKMYYKILAITLVSFMLGLITANKIFHRSPEFSIDENLYRERLRLLTVPSLNDTVKANVENHKVIESKLR